VLKELMENALSRGDPHRGRFRAGGRKLISVADNGEGMNPDDMLMAGERNAPAA
jgi:DNA mismatch repair ATPase MutL